MSLWKISFIQNTNKKISEIFALASKEYCIGEKEDIFAKVSIISCHNGRTVLLNEFLMTKYKKIL